MMAMLTSSARGLRSTPDSMATPSCVKKSQSIEKRGIPVRRMACPPTSR
jgi:hypothetical protein